MTVITVEMTVITAVIFCLLFQCILVQVVYLIRLIRLRLKPCRQKLLNVKGIALVIVRKIPVIRVLCYVKLIALKGSYAS